MDDLLRDFISEANESIEALDRGLVRFEREPEDPDLLGEIFRVMHTIKGTCGFLGLQRLAAVAHAGENILGQFREGSLRPDQSSVSAILEAVDLIKHLLLQLESTGGEPAGNDDNLISRLNCVASAAAPPAAPAEPVAASLEGGLSSVDCAVEIALAKLKSRPEGANFAAVQEDALHASVRDAVWAAMSDGPAGQLSAALKALDVSGAGELEALIECLEFGFSELGVDLSAMAPPPAPARTVQPDATPNAPEAKASAPAASTVSAQTIRVHVDALEQLMNVASELVLIRNQLLQTLRSQPESPFAGPLQRLNHVTTELQESVMTTRMQPIGAAWAKLPRLARDLAIELDKRIELEMQGAETELDRQVLELIKDPLTHMIRNSADHGLETRAERLQAGKPETGRILLCARHEGSHIVIEISDDGRGLQVSKLRAKGLAQNLITPAEAETLSDAKIQQLIFHAGFSTAAAVSGISGRGVGMDVVRTNIEKIGGTVELSSVEGRGTRFTIRIPLTLTIVSALIIDCCGERFAMPQSSVVELVGVGGGSGRAIEDVNGAPVLRLRNRLLPLISLQRTMNLTAAAASEEERSIIVTRVGALSFGIIVDRVFDTEEIVVKPAAGILRGIPFYSGATILGDGAVIMILDPKGIASQIGSAESEEAEVSRRDKFAAHGAAQLLVLRGARGALKATPLQLVSRIEEVSSEAIESANGQPVLQYRGRLMPLVPLDDTIDVNEPGRRRPVIVFEDDARAIGLVVEEIVDIIEGPMAQELKAGTPGVLGSVVVGGKVTDIIDLAHYWRRANAAGSPRGDAAQSRRALIVDPSAFQRNLLAPMLTMAGFEVAMADDVDAAAELIERHGDVDVVLSDYAIAQRERLSTAAPVIGLYDDHAAMHTPDYGRFALTACRLDRDNVIETLEAAMRQAA
jgi:two-component system chemotaxis sensor kinase CheA